MDFSEKEKAWLDAGHYIRFGKKRLGRGIVGEVYEIDNYPNLVIKIPRGFILPEYCKEELSREARTTIGRHWIKTELDNYEDLKDLDFIAPMKPYPLGITQDYGEDYTGIIKPRLRIGLDVVKSASYEQLRDLKESIIELSEHSYVINGNIQAGLNSHDKFVLFDLDAIGMSKGPSKAEAFRTNQLKWVLLMRECGKNALDYGYFVRGA